MFHPERIEERQEPLERCPALVLNADYTPLSYYPLSLWNWQTAIKSVFLDRVAVVAEYDRLISSPTMEMKLPSVIALRDYVKPTTYPAFTRFNLFLRDRFECQYCGSKEDLTFDHVIPRRYGGRTTWENVCAACSPCNLAKGGRTPQEAHMTLSPLPRKPTTHELQANGRAFPHRHCHESWRDFLYWDVTLER
ncbi:HNH endonuclease [Pacificimonas sp. WHA3]|uniref:HNH endonuclease n=1 Tax=Pacificimonas pallii TaxID=2827236 RepID=A0ABS6SBG6_9SPHN|nr:HNH endonuclease [Pacificimonas pallii]